MFAGARNGDTDIFGGLILPTMEETSVQAEKGGGEVEGVDGKVERGQGAGLESWGESTFETEMDFRGKVNTGFGLCPQF